MSLTRLGSLVSQLTHRNLLQRLIITNNQRIFKNEKSSTTQVDDDDDDKPIQYSTSPAASWEARHSQKGGKDEMPWFQPPIVTASVAIFLVYFIILREANDIDDIFEKELGDHFPDLKREAFEKAMRGSVNK